MPAPMLLPVERSVLAAVADALGLGSVGVLAFVACSPHRLMSALNVLQCRGFVVLHGSRWEPTAAGRVLLASHASRR